MRVPDTLLLGASAAFAAYYAESSGLIAPILYVGHGYRIGHRLSYSQCLRYFLKATLGWHLEAKQHVKSSLNENKQSVFYKTTFGDPALRTITWAGVVNNANDGILWAVLPSLLLASGESLTTVGILTGIHASIWGLGTTLHRSTFE